jgi:hypothetical protein
MLLLIAIWVFLIAVCFPIGTTVANAVRHRFSTQPDRFVVSVWIGAVVVCVVLQTLNLITALRPAVSGLTVGAVLLACLSVRSTRREVSSLMPLLAKGGSLLLPIAAGLAFVCTMPIDWFDSGLYHSQVIEWFSEYGTVPGLALVHNRFAFTSSWFAFAAPFNDGDLTFRTQSMLGGFAILMACLHLAFALLRVWSRKTRAQDWYIIVVNLLVLPYVIRSGLVRSSSPDLPVMTLVILIGYLMIRSQTEKEIKGSASIVPVVLAAGAVSIKLSALPILAIAGLYYLSGSKRSLGLVMTRAAQSGLVVLALFTPSVVYSYTVSGCPLYPNPVLCSEGPSSLGAEEAELTSTLVTLWARWSGPWPENQSALNWLPKWVWNEYLASFLLGLSAGCLILYVLIWRRHRERAAGYGFVIAAGIVGSAFMMTNAPNARFGLPFLALIPAATVASVFDSRWFQHAVIGALSVAGFASLLVGIPRPEIVVIALAIAAALAIRLRRAPVSSPPTASAIALSFVIIVLLPIADVLIDHTYSVSPLMPPKMRETAVTEIANPSVTFLKPATGEQCWATELPCTLGNQDVTIIKLRDPAQGLAGGFTR